VWFCREIPNIPSARQRVEDVMSVTHRIGCALSETFLKRRNFLFHGEESPPWLRLPSPSVASVELLALRSVSPAFLSVRSTEAYLPPCRNPPSGSVPDQDLALPFLTLSKTGEADSLLLPSVKQIARSRHCLLLNLKEVLALLVAPGLFRRRLLQIALLLC